MARGLRCYVLLASRYGGNIRAPRAPPNIIPEPHRAIVISSRSLPCALTEPLSLPHRALLAASRRPRHCHTKPREHKAFMFGGAREARIFASARASASASASARASAPAPAPASIFPHYACRKGRPEYKSCQSIHPFTITAAHIFFSIRNNRIFGNIGHYPLCTPVERRT